MIRIDEIYYNVFASAMRHRSRVGLHWFDPFGSVNYNDMINVPAVPYGSAELRLIFWDQEPCYRDTLDDFFSKFSGPTSGLHYDGPKVLVTSERQSKDITWICDKYDLDTCYYFFHGWAALDWYRGYNHSYLANPWQDRDFNYTFICPNNIIGGRRTHRLVLFSELLKRDLVYQNLISFPTHCPYEQISAQDLAKKQGVDLPPCNLPRIIDKNHNHANDSHKIDFWTQGTQAFVHVVTETVYQSDRLHLTEKTFKPIVMQQPFILVAPRQSLGYLRSYGFRTFGNFWDETYDDLPDDQRISAIANLINDISSWTSSYRKEVQREIANIVQHNHDWFYGGFQDLLWNEIKTMIQQW